MDAIEALRTRRSVRAYTKRPVAKEIVEELVDCARLAPTAHNLQPWEFIVVMDEARRKQIADLCEYGAPLAETPVVIVIASQENGFYREDCSCAAEALMVAAIAHDLGSCWIHIHDKDYETDVMDIVDLPNDMRIVCAIGVGHGSAPPMPPKRALESVLHWETYTPSA